MLEAAFVPGQMNYKALQQAKAPQPWCCVQLTQVPLQGSSASQGSERHPFSPPRSCHEQPLLHEWQPTVSPDLLAQCPQDAKKAPPTEK